MLSYLSLEVRTLYHGPVLTVGLNTDAEQYTYSVVWLAYGVALLLFGIWQRSQPARLASAAVTVLTIGKVFLVDMSDLTGVYRALSFIGLGLVLVGIGWLYQRLLFPPRAKTISAPGVPERRRQPDRRRPLFRADVAPERPLPSRKRPCASSKTG